MIKTLIIALAITLVSAAAASGGTVEDALVLVERYSAESIPALESAPSAKWAGELLDERGALKKNAVEELKKLSWAEEPGRRRFKKAAAIVDKYMLDDTGAIERFAGALGAARQKELEPGLEKLHALRKEILQELDESFKRETEAAERLKRREPPPVPSVDTSPLEPGPAGETRGIWDR